MELVLGLFVVLWSGSVRGEVLDPSLFLSPSPPLSPTSNDITPEQRWLEHPRPTARFDLGVLPLQKDEEHEVTDTANEEVIIDAPHSSALLLKDAATPEEESESSPQIDRFWSRHHSGYIGGIHIPLTFAISGYGRYAPSLIASSYANVNTGLYGGQTGHAGLAGSGYSGYGRPGIRIFSSGTAPAWSGWGNGKWGHYGKG